MPTFAKPSGKPARNLSPIFDTQDGCVDFLLDLCARVCAGQKVNNKVDATRLHALTATTVTLPVKGVWSTTTGTWTTPYTQLPLAGNFVYTQATGNTCTCSYLMDYDMAKDTFQVAAWIS